MNQKLIAKNGPARPTGVVVNLVPFFGITFVPIIQNQSFQKFSKDFYC